MQKILHGILSISRQTLMKTRSKRVFSGFGSFKKSDPIKQIKSSYI